MKIPYLGRMVRESTIATFRWARDRARFNKLPPHHPARLLRAIGQNDLITAKELLAQGVSPDYTTDDFKHYFVDEDILGLIDGFSIAGFVPTHYCARLKKNIDALLLLLDHGADIERVEMIQDGWDNYRTTILGTAAFYGKIEAANLLIARGADTNASKAPCPPLICALAGDYTNIEILRLLIDNGADVNRPGAWVKRMNECVDTPLSLASELRRNRKTVLQLLKNAGAVH